jgi:hypothetical protein
MSKRNHRVAVVLGMCIGLSAGLARQAQAQTLTDKDRAEIRKLSDDYVTTLDGCKLDAYANLFTADGAFISGPRGNLVGHEKLEALVTSERHCQPGAAGGSSVSHAFTKVVIDPSAEGATGKVYLPGRDPGSSGGHYEDVYVKTADGWRFKSRKYLSPKEETAASQ